MRILLDLSTSHIWTRPAVGIVRVERKFAGHLLSRGDLEVGFCRFDRELGRHVEVGRDRAEQLAGLAEPPAPGAATAPPPVRLRARAKGAARRAAEAMVRRLPGPLREEAWGTLRAGRDFACGSACLAAGWAGLARARLTRAPADGAPGPRPEGGPPPEPFLFEPGDVYMSMGMDWVLNDFAFLAEERRRVGFRTALFCYDTIPVRFPHLMKYDQREEFTDYLIGVGRGADRVVAISQTTRRDFLALMEEVGETSPPVDVVTLGTDVGEGVAEAEVRSPDPGLAGRPFVLCVNTLVPHKNHETLYHTWCRLAERHGDRAPMLVLVGMVGWRMSDIVYRFRMNPCLKDRIYILEDLSDGGLMWLYRHCLFTVYPSLYEGWGLPVVESLALDVPCLCSDTPAVVEASQGLAEALDPLDVPAWVAAVERLWLDGAAREEAAARVRREFRARTWAEHGEDLVRIAQQLGGSDQDAKPINGAPDSSALTRSPGPPKGATDV